MKTVHECNYCIDSETESNVNTYVIIVYVYS